MSKQKKRRPEHISINILAVREPTLQMAKSEVNTTKGVDQLVNLHSVWRV